MKTWASFTFLVSGIFLLPIAAAEQLPMYDLVIKNARVFDGTGAAEQSISVAVSGDRVVAHLPPGAKFNARNTVDARQQALAPGFINMLSWATESLIVDGRGQSDLRQGVTLEVFGEGWSMGPMTDAMKKEALAQQQDFSFDINWTTLGEYLE
nr:D-aminoacylase [Arenimonas sp.]